MSDEDSEGHPQDQSKISPYGTFRLTPEGAFLMPYETLIAPPSIEMKPAYWPWEKVQTELNKLRALGKSYVGGDCISCTTRQQAGQTARPQFLRDNNNSPRRHRRQAPLSRFRRNQLLFRWQRVQRGGWKALRVGGWRSHVKRPRLGRS